MKAAKPVAVDFFLTFARPGKLRELFTETKMKAFAEPWMIDPKEPEPIDLPGGYPEQCRPCEFRDWNMCNHYGVEINPETQEVCWEKGPEHQRYLEVAK